MYQNEKTQVENTMYNLKIKLYVLHAHDRAMCSKIHVKKIVKQVMVGDTC